MVRPDKIPNSNTPLILTSTEFRSREIFKYIYVKIGILNLRLLRFTYFYVFVITSGFFQCFDFPDTDFFSALIFQIRIFSNNAFTFYQVISLSCYKLLFLRIFPFFLKENFVQSQFKSLIKFITSNASKFIGFILHIFTYFSRFFYLKNFRRKKGFEFFCGAM